MIRVRVSNSFKSMKQDCIDYLIKNKLYKIAGNIIRLAIDSDGEMVLFMTKDTYAKWCKGKTYYDDIDKCYKHSGYKVSNELAEQLEYEELKRNLQEPIDIYENLC